MIVYLSASQYSTADAETPFGCMRKWAFEYKAGYERPPTLATVFGNRVHWHMENYLRDGTIPPLEDRLVWEGRTYWPGACAQTMIGEHLPKPGEGLVEGKFTWHDEKHGIHWRGYKDCVVHMPGRTTWLIDHKTSTDPAAWGHTPASLRKDPQYLLYARSEIDNGNAERVTATWNYGSRDAKPQKARIVQISESATVVVERYEERVVPLAQKLVQLHASGSQDPMDYEPNPNACGAGGGCPHRQRCNLTTEQHLGALFMSKKSLLNETLDEDEELEDLPPRKRSRLLDDDDDDVVEEAPPKRASARRAAPVEDDDEDDAPPPRKRSRLLADDDEEEEEEEPAPKKAQSRTVDVDDEDEPAPKKRGRPAGSKNKAKPQPPPAEDDLVNPPEAKAPPSNAREVEARYIEDLADAVATRVFEKLADALSKAAAR